jgi:hypothetical protein
MAESPPWWKIPWSTTNTLLSGTLEFWETAFHNFDLWWQQTDETIVCFQKLLADLGPTTPYCDAKYYAAVETVVNAENKLWQAWWTLQNSQTEGEKLGLAPADSQSLLDMIMSAHIATSKATKVGLDLLEKYRSRRIPDESSTADGIPSWPRRTSGLHNYDPNTSGAL